MILSDEDSQIMLSQIIVNKSYSLLITWSTEGYVQFAGNKSSLFYSPYVMIKVLLGQTNPPLCCTGCFEMPYHVAGDEMLSSLRQKCTLLKQRLHELEMTSRM